MYDQYIIPPRKEEPSCDSHNENPFGCTLNPPPPHDSHHPMCPPDHFGHPDAFEHPGPCHPNGPDIYNPGVPNPVIHTEYHHQHPPNPPRPEKEMYVTKKQLNEILKNIAEADIFTDTTVNGTTCSVGGIVKGTKFSNKLTLVDFIEKLLYSEDSAEGAYITQGELEEALNNIEYSSLKNIPSTFDFKYPCRDENGIKILNYIVTTPIGGFSDGDSLENMNISRIFEKLLCAGPDIWGKTVWESEMYDVSSGTLEINAEDFCPNIILDADNDIEGSEHWFETSVNAGKYELYAVVPTIDKNDTTQYKYDCLIACNTAESQVTNSTWEDIPSTLSWSYNYDTKKIVLSGAGITTDMTVIMIAREI